jgi:hypothetical protein
MGGRAAVVTVAVVAGLVSLVSSAGVARAQQVVFPDGFESAPTTWTLFEEVVGGNACYGTGIGSVAQTTEQAHSGSGSLRVWANQAGSLESDHVIAQQHLSTSGVSGRYRYDVWSLVDPAAGDGLHEGQTGPEISLQNTRQVGATFATTTGGVQYVANKWSGQGTWNVWTDTGSGAAGWVSFATQTLSPGVWYELALDVDYDANRYVSLAVTGGSVSLRVDLSSRVIVPESKFTQTALWATLEGENAWSTCSQDFQYRTYYDDVRVERLTAPAPATPGGGWIVAGVLALAYVGARTARRKATRTGQDF